MASPVQSRTERGVEMPFQTLTPPAWEALTLDTGASVLVLDENGIILYANSRTVLELKLPVEEMVGKPYHGFFAPEFGAERLGFIRRAIETGTPMVIDHTFGGCRRRTCLRPLPADAQGRHHVLLVCRPAQENDPAEVSDAEMVRAKHNDLGSLASLTPRELEILFLIGQGLATSEIAKQLHRSEKTVEWHRVSLGNKLGVSNRVELARIAIQSGLLAATPRSRTTPETK